MEKLERIYNKAMKTLGIASLKETEKIVKNLFGDYMDIIPEDQLYKVSTKFVWDINTSVIGNIQILIVRNICEFVAKYNGYLKKGYKFKDGGMDENENFLIVLDSPADYTKEVTEEFEFNGDKYFITYNIPVKD